LCLLGRSQNGNYLGAFFPDLLARAGRLARARWCSREQTGRSREQQATPLSARTSLLTRASKLKARASKLTSRASTETLARANEGFTRATFHASRILLARAEKCSREQNCASLQCTFPIQPIEPAQRMRQLAGRAQPTSRSCTTERLATPSSRLSAAARRLARPTSRGIAWVDQPRARSRAGAGSAAGKGNRNGRA
jgi:hypothetical protein